MRLSWEETHFFKDTTSLNEVSLRSSFAQSVNGYNFIFFGVVRSYSQEIVTFTFLKLNVGDIILS